MTSNLRPGSPSRSVITPRTAGFRATIRVAHRPETKQRRLAAALTTSQQIVAYFVVLLTTSEKAVMRPYRKPQSPTRTRKSLNDPSKRSSRTYTHATRPSANGSAKRSGRVCHKRAREKLTKNALAHRAPARAPAPQARPLPPRRARRHPLTRKEASMSTTTTSASAAARVTRCREARRTAARCAQVPGAAHQPTQRLSPPYACAAPYCPAQAGDPLREHVREQA